MPLGNPIRKQNESRMVSVLATEGQTVFTVQGGYIVNHISVFRNGVRLSNSEDFTAGDGSTVTLNNAANIDDRIEFHIFDRFTVQNAIVGAASSQTISGDLVLTGKLFGELDVPSINTGIATVTELDVNGKGDISGDLNVVGVTTTGGGNISGDLNVTGVTTTGGGNISGDLNVTGVTTVGKQVHVGTGVSIAAGGLNVTAGISTFQAVQGTTGTFSAAVSGTTGTFSAAVSGTTGTFTGDVSIADKIVHTGDTDTAIRFSAADTVSVETGGTQKLSLGSATVFNETGADVDFRIEGDTTPNLFYVNAGTNKIGIGNRPDPKEQLEISGSVYLTLGTSTANEGHALKFQNKTGGFDTNYGAAIHGLRVNDSSSYLRFDTGGTSEKMRLDASGRLLVGTNSSRTVWGNHNNLQIEGTGGGANGVSITRNTNDAFYPYLAFGKSRGTSNGSSTVVQDDDVTGIISFNAADGTDMNNQTAYIESAVDGTPGGNDTPGRLAFYTTADGSGSSTERLRINSTGNIVTQGLTGPSFNNDSSNAKVYEFTGDGTANEYGVINISGNSNTNEGYVGILRFVNRENSNSSSGGNANSKALAVIQTYAITSDSNAGDDSGGRLQFLTKPESGNLTERLRISSAGLVSIPVAGNLQVGGTGSGETDSKIYVANTGGDAYIQIKGADSSGTVGLKFGRNSVANRAGIDWSASTDALVFRSGGTTEAARITNGQKILVGSTSMRDIGGSAAQSVLQLEGVSQNRASISLINNQASATAASLRFGKTRGTSVGAVDAVTNGDALGQIRFVGSDGTDLENTTAMIIGKVSGSVSGNTIPTDLIFETSATNGTSRAERLRITSGGDTELRNIVSSITNAYSQYLKFRTTQTNGQSAVTGQIAAQGKSGWGGDLVFYSKPANSTPNDSVTERLRIGSDALTVNAAGNVFNAGATAVNTTFTSAFGGAGATSVVRVTMNTSANDGLQLQQNGSGTSIAGGNHATSIFNREDARMRLGTDNTEQFRIEANGNLKANDTTIASLSDSRLKKNIVDFTYDLTKFKNLKPRIFDWINPELHGNKSNVRGFIAQEIETVDSTLVGEYELFDEGLTDKNPDLEIIVADDGTNIAKDAKLGTNDAMYISVIQQLITKIETLETKVAALEGS